MKLDQRHSNCKYQHDPHEYGMRLQFFNKQTEFLSLPNRMPPNQKKKMLSRADRKDGAYFIEIGDLYQFEDWIRAEENTDTKERESYNNGKSFAGTSSVEESLQIAHDGDPAIIKYVQEQAKQILLEKKDMIDAPYDVHRDVEGLFHDVGLYLMGEPESFYNEKNTLIPDKCLDVHLVCSYNCNIDEDDVKENIKYIVAAISVLEMSGHRVAVHAWWHSHQESGHPNNNIYKQIKDYRQPMNLAMLVGISHPGFFRRLTFRIKELMGADDWGYGHSYGKMDNCTFDLGQDVDGVEEALEMIKSGTLKKDEKKKKRGLKQEDLF